MQAILNFIVDILSQPAILVALIAFIGLIVQKNPPQQSLPGTIQTILGFLILAQVLMSSFDLLTIRQNIPTRIRCARYRTLTTKLSSH